MYGLKEEKKLLIHFSKLPQNKVIEKKTFVLKEHKGE